VTLVKKGVTEKENAEPNRGLDAKIQKRVGGKNSSNNCSGGGKAQAL